MSEHLGAAGIHVVEVDEDAGAYSALGHIPGAIALDWRTDLQSSTSRDIVGAEEFAALLGARGIAPGDTVVLYGGNHNWFAAFGYWLFKLYGHADVRMLDGGRMKWTMEGRPLTDEVPEPVATDYPVPDVDAEIRALRSDVLDGLEDDVLIDVRSVDEFTGRLLAPPHLPQEGGQQRGHIPGALSIPWNRAVARDGTFRSDEDLRRLYAKPLLAAEDGARVVTYCRIGERSSHTWFVLRELLGVSGVANYDGSWVEYGSLIGVPVER